MLGTSPRRWTAIAVVAAVLVAAGWLVVRHLTQDQLAAGFVAPRSLAVADLTEQAEVRLPIGTLALSAGSPLDHVSFESIGRSGDGDVTAAAGAAIVPLAWSFTPANLAAEPVSYPSTFDLSVGPGSGDVEDFADAGETRIDLTGSGDGLGPMPQQTMVAVVQGDGDHVRVAVTYEDVTQVADLTTGNVDAGSAAALYDEPASTTLDAQESCDATPGADLDRLTADDGFLFCDLELLERSPYLPYLGWAEDGETWTVATLSVTSADRVRWLGSDARYRVRRGEPRMRLDGRRAADQTCTAPSGTQTCTAVFSGPSDEQPSILRADAPLTARKTDERPGPDPVGFGVHQTFHLAP